MNIKDLQSYVKPHHIVSKSVETKQDIQRVIEDGQKMYDLLEREVKWNPNTFAIAHSQITEKEPLRFFVTLVGEFVNPRIVRHTEVPCMRTEGCLTFRFNEPIKMMRYYRCTVAYQTINDDDTLSEEKFLEVKGLEAQVWQHEIDHMDARYVFSIPEESKIEV